ncbi:CatA-like O-acetyltransferase [Pacificoceanicola onchidii]|uniref:CatA-like O-acetyltransferase n=1 Tax=Pacificoceanicola onchidii TaxID=2562685 RepID=UPI0010A38C7C|nr:CatA-like O-acetyltransferase [Pacificoceanicola onchidii]
MATHPVDLSKWPRAAQYRLFRGYERPHYAITVRLDLTHVMARKASGLSPYHACLFAIGAGIHAVPELCMRFRGETVVRHDRVSLSMPVPRADGGFNFGYVPFDTDFARFDKIAAQRIAQARAATDLNPIDDSIGDAVVFASCLPWLDFTALDNALPNAEDCIPRVSWGKIVPEQGGFRAAMTIQVHHALADGAHLGVFFETVQETLGAL